MIEDTKFSIEWTVESGFALITSKNIGFNVYITGKHKATSLEIAEWMCNRLNGITEEPMPE